MKNETTIGGITVGGQPSEDELAQAKNGRFTTVINIREDDEDGNITAASLAGSDVDYESVPWTKDTVTTDDIRRIRDAANASDGPVLIHCAGATRAAAAAGMIAAEREGKGADDAITMIEAAGFPMA